MKHILCTAQGSQAYHAKWEDELDVALVEMFIDYGYQVCLIDEHSTSKRCSKCKATKAICTPFLQVENPNLRIKGKNPTIKRWGLTKCSKCNQIHNRDINAALNQLAIVEAHVANEARPKRFMFKGYERIEERTSMPAERSQFKPKPVTPETNLKREMDKQAKRLAKKQDKQVELDEAKKLKREMDKQAKKLAKEQAKQAAPKRNRTKLTDDMHPTTFSAI